MIHRVLLAIAIVVWSVLVAGTCFLGLVFLVGHALARREGRPTQRFGAIVLKPGIVIGGGNLAVVLLVSWATWTAAGAMLILLCRLI